MNNTRREELKNIQEGIKAFKEEADTLKEKLEELKGKIEEVRDEEESAYDNLPESLQESEKGERMQAEIDALSDAIVALYDASGSVESYVNDIEESLGYAVDNLQEVINN